MPSDSSPIHVPQPSFRARRATQPSRPRQLTSFGAIVHQGAIGITEQALRAGRPMLVMPSNNDQSDNAARELVELLKDSS